MNLATKPFPLLEKTESALGVPVGPIAVPDLAAVHPAYDDALAKKLELQQRLKQIEIEVIDLVNRRNKVVTDTDAERVNRLLDEPVPETVPVAFVQDDAARHEQLAQMRRDLIEAIRLQEERIGRERMTASLIVLDRLKPQMHALERSIALALTELLPTLQVYQQLQTDLDTKNVILPPDRQALPVHPMFGNVLEEDSGPAEFLAAAQRRGVIADRELPQVPSRKP